VDRPVVEPADATGEKRRPAIALCKRSAAWLLHRQRGAARRVGARSNA